MQTKNKNTIIQISERLQKDIDLDILDSRGEYFSYRVVEGTPNVDYSGLVLYNCIVKNDIKLKGAFSLRSSQQLNPNRFLKRMGKLDEWLVIEEGIHLEGCTLSFLEFKDCVIPNSTFENVFFENVAFYGCTLDGSTFKNCRFEGLQLTELGYPSDATKGSYRNLRFENCKFEAYLLPNEPVFFTDTSHIRTTFGGDFENTFFDKDCELSVDSMYIDGIEYGIRNPDSIVFESGDIESIWNFSYEYLE